MKVQVCTGKSCRWRYSNYVITRIENDSSFYNDWKWVEVVEETCMWHCKQGPNIKLKNQIINYCSPTKASEVIAKHIVEDNKKKNSKKKK